MRNLAVLESIQSRFELSIHLSVFFFPANHTEPWTVTGKKIQRNVWKVQNTTGRFLAKLHRFVFKILFLMPKVSNSCTFQKRSFMKIIWQKRNKVYAVRLIQFLLHQIIMVWSPRSQMEANQYCFHLGFFNTRACVVPMIVLNWYEASALT